MFRSFSLILCFLCVSGFIFCQNSSENKSDTLSYLLIEADTSSTYFWAEDGHSLDTLIGNVILTQDSLVMYCNWAVVIDQIYANAYEDVVIIHEDSIQIFADSMHYDGTDKVAELFGKVILQDGQRRLYTDYLIYDVGEKTAQYYTGATIIDVADTIVSKEGYYFQEAQLAQLRGNVSYRDSSRTLLTDSIDYFYSTEQLNIIAPTKIFQDSIIIYCESGVYQLENERGILSQNVQVQSQDQLITAGLLDIVGAQKTYTFLFDPAIQDSSGIARGDSIIYFDQRGVIEVRNRASYTSDDGTIEAPLLVYDQAKKEYSNIGRAQINTQESIIDANDIVGMESGNTILKGRVRILDKESQVLIESDEALQESDRTKVYSINQQPLLTYPLKGDSLFLKADTLISQEVYVDSLTKSDILLAKIGVKLMNGKTTGISSDFRFDQSDSVITMWGSPILWNDSTQLSGDTIKIYIKNQNVEKVSLINNAFILSPDSIGNYNQIKGIQIDNYLKDQEIKRSYVQKNAELFYLVEKDGSYQGINITKSSEMTFQFNEDGISRIYMGGNPESNMYEYVENMDLSIYYLSGYQVRIDEKPNTIEFVSKSVQWKK